MDDVCIYKGELSEYVFKENNLMYGANNVSKCDYHETNDYHLDLVVVICR